MTKLFEVSREDTEGTEGKLTSGRGLAFYKFCLRFNENLLERQTVLNFGCGGSAIGRQLDRKGVESTVIDLDLQFDPVNPNSLRGFLAATIDVLDMPVSPKSNLHRHLLRARRVIGGRSGRNFVQGDGRALPFESQTFDTTLALFSTHQIPEKAKEGVYRELLRVTGSAFHCCPIFKRDFVVLTTLAKEEGFEIVICHPHSPLHRERFRVKDPSDYQKYIDHHSTEERITPPSATGPAICRLFGHAVPPSIDSGASFIVLHRKSSPGSK